MIAALAWGIRVMSVVGFIAAFLAFVLIAVPEYGFWRVTGFPNRVWVNASDESAFLAMICLICCGILRAIHHDYFAHLRLQWCVWSSIAAVIIALLTPALAIVERPVEAGSKGND